MGHFYFDDSNHSTRGGFIVGAFAYFPQDPAPRIAEAIREVGLRPGVDEFKSGFRMDRHPEQARLRDALYALEARLALVVCGRDEAQRLGHEGVGALASIVAGFGPGQGPHHAYFDRGIFRSIGDGERAFAEFHLHDVVGHFEQDSRTTLGIQTADLAAHTCAMMLRERLGLLLKDVPMGPDSGYEEDATCSIGFELWARTRYNWFHGPSAQFSGDGEFEVEHATVPVDGYGLFISSTCPDPVRAAARDRFGSMYLGCIH